MEIKFDRVRLLVVVIVPILLAGCAARTTRLVAATPTATAVFSPTPEVMEVDTGGQLVSQWAAAPPLIDGRIDDLWSTADLLPIPLFLGQGGAEYAYDLKLRSLHTDDTIAFLAQWPGDRPAGPEDTVFNQLTMHWRIPEQAAQGLNCTVVCHTAFADGNGRVAYANAETIPQGGHETLPVAGGWDAGIWTLEWSRPLVTGNPFDLQFADRDRAYSFLVKVFARIEGRPDPISGRHLLVFQP